MAEAFISQGGGDRPTHALNRGRQRDGWVTWRSYCGAYVCDYGWDTAPEQGMPTCKNCLRCIPEADRG